MATHIAENSMLNLALRALQVIFAIIIMGTDGYAINVYRGHTSFVDTPWGGYEGYFGVPNAWGFLIFCAGWTVLVVIFYYVAEKALTRHLWVGYIRIAVEAIALLSWFAGWIAVAVNIGTGACADSYVSCGALKAATVFGAFEWLLFMVTAFFTVSWFFYTKRQAAMFET
ncbi:uncharacterized protein yc1106_08515 [Curvularia clavata]|uniref:MARVEL domain-containing protein n=1 Tax=Curvularia clavata TaxID=95742 RepID=A0A9Q8ZFN4_CURCL|nr:uncharacterized protein yc1106_08515 [Curvularia clavata]